MASIHRVQHAFAGAIAATLEDESHTLIDKDPSELGGVGHLVATSSLWSLSHHHVVLASLSRLLAPPTGWGTRPHRLHTVVEGYGDLGGATAMGAGVGRPHPHMTTDIVNSHVALASQLAGIFQPANQLVCSSQPTSLHAPASQPACISNANVNTNPDQSN